MKRKTPLQQAMLDAPQLARLSGVKLETVRAILYEKRHGLPATRRKLATALRQHSATLAALADALEPPPR